MEKPKLVNGKCFEDKRGVFAPLSIIKSEEPFNKKWIQSNISLNPKPYTLRGLHFQVGETAQSKLVKVINGEIIDFIVDIRPDSEDYMKLYVYEMKMGDELLVPKGFAHGFITLEENSIVQYLVDNDYSPETEGSIYWKDINEIYDLLKVYESNLIISDKDLITKNFV